MKAILKITQPEPKDELYITTATYDGTLVSVLIDKTTSQDTPHVQVKSSPNNKKMSKYLLRIYDTLKTKPKTKIDTGQDLYILDAKNKPYIQILFKTENEAVNEHIASMANMPPVGPITDKTPKDVLLDKIGNFSLLKEFDKIL